MRILLVSDQLGSLHWLIFATIFWGLATYAWAMFYEVRYLRAFAEGVALTSLALIASVFWLIQTDRTGIDPMILFAIERALWWPLGLSLFVLLDIMAADYNGHRSLIARLTAYLERKRNEHTHQ